VELVYAEMYGDLSLEELADAAGLSITHFSQMFRQSTGQSPHQFVLHRKLERANEMLRAEGRVLDVAVACGFKSQQHFARVFRSVCGASPTEYRQEFAHRDHVGLRGHCYARLVAPILCSIPAKMRRSFRQVLPRIVCPIPYVSLVFRER
jgi:AraC-like DNA-binding protein